MTVVGPSIHNATVYVWCYAC